MSDSTGTSEDGVNKEDGLGSEGTIPSGSHGVGVGAGKANTFEPEEDPETDGDSLEGSGHA